MCLCACKLTHKQNESILIGKSEIEFFFQLISGRHIGFTCLYTTKATTTITTTTSTSTIYQGTSSELHGIT